MIMCDPNRCVDCGVDFLGFRPNICPACFTPQPQRERTVRKEIAGYGEIFVCAACGKTSKQRVPTGGSEWDESCMMHAVLCYEKKRSDGTWVAVGAN